MGIAQDILSGLLDLIYPPHCLICEKAGAQYLCEECIAKIEEMEGPFCPICGAPTTQIPCPHCKDMFFSFRAARSAGFFDGVLQEAIHMFKYRSKTPLADPLAAIMTERLSNYDLLRNVDLIIPVPIHKYRYLERGYNQSQLLALRISASVLIPCKCDVIKKTKNTAHQVDLERQERLTNPLGAFEVINRSAIRGKHILLIDDVFTTGSTLNAASEALRSAGATAVYAYTLARSL